MTIARLAHHWSFLFALLTTVPSHACRQEVSEAASESAKAITWIEPRLVSAAKQFGYVLRPASPSEIVERKLARFFREADSVDSFLEDPYTHVVVLAELSAPDVAVGMIAYGFYPEAVGMRMPVVKAVDYVHRASGMAAFLQATALEHRRRVHEITGQPVFAASSVRRHNYQSIQFNLSFGYSEVEGDAFYRSFELHGEPAYRGKVKDALSAE